MTGRAFLIGIAAGVAVMASLACAVAPAPDPSQPTTPPVVNEDVPRPNDADRATGAVAGYDEGVLFCGVNAGVAVDVDPFGNSWAYCEPALALGEGR